MTVYEYASSVASQSRKARRLLKGHNLTLAQIDYLMTLEKHGIVTMGGVARLMGVAVSTLTLATDVLERRGLVARAHSTTDRRVVLIQMTPEGRAVLNGLKSAAVTTEESA